MLGFIGLVLLQLGYDIEAMTDIDIYLEGSVQVVLRDYEHEKVISDLLGGSIS
jgi:hypothetical protein